MEFKMYCSVCGKLKWHIICNKCLSHLEYIDSKRVLDNGVKVFSNFAFSELKLLLTSKNNIIGSRIFKRLGVYAISMFFKRYKDLATLKNQKIAVLSIRNKTIGVYSHSAILAQCFRMYGFKVFHNALIIGNDSHFSHLKREERQRIGRNFTFHFKRDYMGVIIVDDIITTGQTLFEASNIIMQNDYTPLFAWTLCDSKY
ncbi:ComF family protein [Helicobacter trogontum]|nr:ComF family protein [Helicobacter trogontum]